MPIISVRIPQIGEGLQEARLVAVLKQPGDTIRRDEPIYQMETDKAVMDVESPYDGVLVEWLAKPDDILPIGGEVARFEVSEGVDEMVVHGAPASAQSETASTSVAPTTPSSRNQNIPPRTRAYAKEKGISDEQLSSISAKGSKLMPEDIDVFLAGDSQEKGYSETAMGQKQRLTALRLQRGSQLVVPGTITVAVNWEPLEAARSMAKSNSDQYAPSSFTMFAFAVVKALKDHPAFRTTLIGESTLRCYDHVSLGIAVALPGDELVLAVVDKADTLVWPAFAQRTREQIELARSGKDQAHEAVSLSLTNMQAFGLRDAVPVVVPPSIATLFLGAPYFGLAQDVDEPQIQKTVNIALTFDHRLINGVGASNFINSVKENIETIGSIAI